MEAVMYCEQVNSQGHRVPDFSEHEIKRGAGKIVEVDVYERMYKILSESPEEMRIQELLSKVLGPLRCRSSSKENILAAFDAYMCDGKLYQGDDATVGLLGIHDRRYYE
jgi:hypothetical protein